jgi:hypothetical protein
MTVAKYLVAEKPDRVRPMQGAIVSDLPSPADFEHANDAISSTPAQ